MANHGKDAQRQQNHDEPLTRHLLPDEETNNCGTEGDKGEELAKKTGKGAAVGGAVGAAVGAVTGNFGRGTAAGAAGGAAGGMTRGLFEANEPDPVTKRFVERCLRERGYEPIGWK